jgi:DNA-binding HxlR family transcriptional regulator
LAERWTPIIVRNLLRGCCTFSEIRQGAPGISSALLSQRLDALERHGIIDSAPNGTGRGRSYQPTEKGRDLTHVCDALGQWGARWLEIEPHHLDPAYTLWATMNLVDISRLPEQTVVVRFGRRDKLSDRFWLILRKPQPELCTKALGYVEDMVPAPTPPAWLTSTSGESATRTPSEAADSSWTDPPH